MQKRQNEYFGILCLFFSLALHALSLSLSLSLSLPYFFIPPPPPWSLPCSEGFIHTQTEFFEPPDNAHAILWRRQRPPPIRTLAGVDARANRELSCFTPTRNVSQESRAHNHPSVNRSVARVLLRCQLSKKGGPLFSLFRYYFIYTIKLFLFNQSIRISFKVWFYFSSWDYFLKLYLKMIF